MAGVSCKGCPLHDVSYQPSRVSWYWVPGTRVPGNPCTVKSPNKGQGPFPSERSKQQSNRKGPSPMFRGLDINLQHSHGTFPQCRKAPLPKQQQNPGRAPGPYQGTSRYPGRYLPLVQYQHIQSIFIFIINHCNELPNQADSISTGETWYLH